MTFRLSGTLLRFVDYRREIRVDAPDLRRALALLCEMNPDLRPVLHDGAGQVRETHRLFLNGAQLAGRDLDQPLGPDDCVEVLTAIAGG